MPFIQRSLHSFGKFPLSFPIFCVVHTSVLYFPCGLYNMKINTQKSKIVPLCKKYPQLA